MQIDNEKWNELVRKRESEDEIFIYYKNKNYSIHWLNSGKFGPYIQFQKTILRLIRQINLKSPTAISLFLYCIEHNMDYPEDPKSEVPFDRKRLMRECSIKNGKSLYEAIEYLQNKNMIFLIEKDDRNGNKRKVIKINRSIKFWNVNEDIKMKIYNREKERLYSPSD